MRSLTTIAIVWICLPVFGQRLSAYWSTDSCSIGEQVTLHIRLEKAPQKVEYKPLSGEISCKVKTDSAALLQDGTLEVIRAFHDSTYTRGTVRFWEGAYVLTAWDTGIYVFPPIQLLAGDTMLRGQPAAITVSFVKKTITDDLDEVPVEVTEDPWWWLKAYWWLGLFPLAGILLFWIRKRNSRTPKKVLSLRERMHIGIRELRKQAYWERGMINEHYIEFSFLLRTFLSSRYELNLMERTTYETVVLLRTKGIPEPALERIRRLLLEADTVKFAKGIPATESVLMGLTYLEQLVEELSPLELVQ